MSQNYLTSLTPHIYWSPRDEVRDRPVMGAVLGRRSTLIVEAGASPAHAAQFTAALRDLGGEPARYVALTHWHWDHSFGIAAVGLPTFAHRGTRRRVAEMARLDWTDAALDARVAAGTEKPFIADHVKVELSNAERASLVIAAPDVIFDTEVEIDLGGLTARLVHVAGDHTPDSSVVFIPEERVVFLGDCLYSGPAGEEYVYTPDKLFPMLGKLLQMDADYYYLAHAPAAYTRNEFVNEANALRAIGAIVAQSGGDREDALSRLAPALGRPPGADDLDTLDAFLVGLRLGA